MCVQKYTSCRNYKCDNICQTLDVLQCPDKPNCETTLVRVPAVRFGSHKVHCDHCAALTPVQRKRERRKMERLCAAEQQPQQDADPVRQAPHSQETLGPYETQQGECGFDALPTTMDEEQQVKGEEELSAKPCDDAYDAAMTLLAISRGGTV